MALPEIDVHSKHFSYIIAIAECGTITAAAEQLYISQPALSRYLKSLEDRLGVVLFDRIDNRLYLSPAGQQYVQWAKQIVEMENRMEKVMTQLRSETRKHIRMGIPEHWASYLIPPLMLSITKNMPQISLEIMDVNSRTLEKMLIEHEVDLTISRRPNNLQDITSEFLHSDPIYLAAPSQLAPSFHTIGRSPNGLPIIDPLELSRLRYILPQKNQTLRNKIDAIFEDLQILPEVVLTFRSIEASMRLVGCGFSACCFVSEMHMRSVSLQSEPVYFAIDHPQAMLSLHVNYLSRRRLPPHIQQFIREISKTI